MSSDVRAVVTDASGDSRIWRRSCGKLLIEVANGLLRVVCPLHGAELRAISP